LEAGNGARRAVNRPDLPTALGEDHEKYSTEVSAAAKYSWKAALEGGAYPRQRSAYVKLSCFSADPTYYMPYIYIDIFSDL
jgi:hypothetical protein